MAYSGTVINSVFDVTSGEENGKLTPGGGANISGTKIRVEGDKPGIGLKLIHVGTAVETEIPATSILLNDPSKIMFIVPAALAPGDYRIVLTTQFSGTKQLLKEPRVYEFEYMLNV